MPDIPEREVKSRGKAFEVRKIRKAEFCSKTLQLQYRVSWKGYGREDDSWEPASSLWGCEDMLKEFNRRVKSYQAHLAR